MRNLMLISAGLLALPLLASAQPAALGAQDAGFVAKAAAAGLAEVQDGQLAESKGDASVQAIGKRMVTDHTEINSKLESLARSRGISLPTHVTPMQAAEHAKLQELNSGFDKAYLADQKTAHEKAIKLFQTEANSGTAPDLKAFAAHTLPTLKMHLQMIEAAQK